ncbi:MAG: DUF167 domain-containing protein [Deltaproteobacteria bacterium]|nr:DUF167 domain-containing protein [Deltaproteobacteria bacterium]
MYDCLTTGSDVQLHLHIVPRAKKSAVLGMHGARLKISIAAPPNDNAANDALIEFLAAEIGVPKRSLTLVRGQAARQKTVSFPKECSVRLSEWLKTVLA